MKIPVEQPTVQLSKEEFAAMISGRQISQLLNASEIRAAKSAGLFIIYGDSDDVISVRGLQNNDFDVDDHWVSGNGIVDITEEQAETLKEFGFYDQFLEGAVRLECYFDEPGQEFSWEFKVDMQHSTFEIYEGEERFCLGIVLDSKDFS